MTKAIRLHRPLAAALALLAGTAAVAADLDIEVKDARGRPVADAVVTVHFAARATPAPKVGTGYMIDQQNIQFQPFVTVIPVGARVMFMNHDATRHHVYSFSPAKHFELKLEQKQQNRDVVFDKPGIVPLGCNIHDKMIAFIDVVDTPFAVKTGADGRATFKGLPATGVTVTVWHPYLKAPGNHIDRSIPLTDGAPRREGFGVSLRSPPNPPAISDY